MKKKLLVLLTALLYLLIVISSNVYADDNFIYGVQIFNRPIDWYWDSYNHSKEAGTEAVKQMISYAAELNADLVRGGLQYSNMYSQLKRDGEKDMWGLKLLLPLLAEKNLMLDWVISGTDSNLGMTNPPDINEWQELISYGARSVSSEGYQSKVIYEIWNEPDLPGLYWNGSCEDYYDKYLPSALSSIKGVYSGANIINGGLLLDRSDSNSENEALERREYLRRAVAELNAGNISMLAVHSHNSFYRFMELIDNESLLENADMSKVFLNESGYAWNTEGGITFNIAAKILGAKALGMKGIVVFHMGLKSSLIKDEIERESQLINVADNGTLTPTESYYAVKAAIRFTKGLTPDSGNDVSASDEGYAWLFRSDDGKKKTLVSIGKNLTQSEVTAALGTESYEAYDISGDVFSGSSTGKYDIVYYVTNDEPEPPELEKIRIITSQSDIENKECKVNEYYSLVLESYPYSVNWSKYDGDLPPGLTLQNSNLIAGVPTQAGKYEFTLLAELEGYESSQADFSITVKSEDKVMQAISIKTDKLNDATEGENYSAVLESDPSGAAWECSNLPEGLSVTSSNSSGRIRGKPSARGEYTLHITASKEGWLSSNVSLSLTVKAPLNPSSGDIPVPPSIVTVQGDIVSGKFGEQYRLKLSSDKEGVRWILEYNSSLPEGLSLDENTGIISGIPKDTGSFKFSVYAEKDGLSSDSKTFTITIDYAGKIEIITSQKDFDDNECIAGSAYYLELETIPESVSWDIYSGKFPSEFDKTSLRNSGRILGVPSRAGRYNFTLIASIEGYESESREFTLNVKEASSTPSTGGVSKGGGCTSGFGAICALTMILLLKRK